jgi:hypothetical protein
MVQRKEGGVRVLHAPSHLPGFSLEPHNDDLSIAAIKRRSAITTLQHSNLKKDRIDREENIKLDFRE